MPITPLPTPVPSTTDPANFAARADAFLGALPAFATEANVLGAQATADASTATTKATSATSSEAVAVAAANFKGTYASRTGAATVPYSVSHLGLFWMLLSNLADVTTKVPGTDPEWQEIPITPASSYVMTYQLFGAL